MAKKQNINAPVGKGSEKAEAVKSVPRNAASQNRLSGASKPISDSGEAVPKNDIFSFRIQAIIVAVIGLLFYANTFWHEYAFDDMMAIVDNSYVQKGVAGIPEILRTDAFQSYLESRNADNQLEGGRYRPLSLITFAVEQQILGINENDGSTKESERLRDEKMVRDMHPRHVANVLLYIGSVILLLYFLRTTVFPSNTIFAFVAAMLFLIHPLHTEVVANVKSRDEILSLLFFTLTFITALQYFDNRSVKNLVATSLCLFLALLSKEYALTMVVLLPLLFYFFRKTDLKTAFVVAAPINIAIIVYLILRFTSVSGAAEGAEKDIMNNPYLYATLPQQVATKLFVLLQYLKLLFLPATLSVDYSYNAIPYVNFANIWVYVALLLHLLLVMVMVFLFNKRHVLSFAIAFYMLNLALVSNFIFNIGAPMGERLIYHSSVGFVIAIAWLVKKLSWKFRSFPQIRTVYWGLAAVIIVTSGFRTIDRNNDWKNNKTLFLHDVKYAGSSVRINTDAAAACMAEASKARYEGDTAQSREWFAKAIGYFSTALAINPNYMVAYLNRGLCYFNSGIPEKAVPDWDTVKLHTPNMQNLAKYTAAAGRYFYGKGMNDLKTGNFVGATEDFKQSLDLNPQPPEVWYQLALSYYLNHDYAQANAILNEAIKTHKGNSDLMRLWGEVKNAMDNK
jgi:protein O-mannosyl-transferase